MYKNILIPVLLDDGHDVTESFNAARTLAAEGAQFTIMNVIEEVPAYAALAISEDILSRTFTEAEVALREAGKLLPGAQTKLTRGHPGPVIVDYAVKNGVDCIVLRSHKPGFENFFIGSTADRVVRHAKCSVHVIR